MQLTKYIHSCVLLEEAGEKLLFDPGKFSFNEGLVKPEIFSDVSTIVITHSHPDHVEVEALKQIVAQSGAIVVANSKVAANLQAQNIPVTIMEEGSQQFGGFTLQAIPTKHEPILAEELPPVTAFLVNNRVLNPGDSFQPSLFGFEGVELLILPVMAPWLTELAVFDFARRMKPRQVIPVHDGYAKDFFIKLRYDNYIPYFDQENIKFHPLSKPGDAITL